MIDDINLPELPSLYEKTGSVADINTLLVNRVQLVDLLRARAVRRLNAQSFNPSKGKQASGDAQPSERERHFAEKAVEGNAWRLAALRVGANKFQQLPPVGYYDWSPQQWCDWVMAQPTTGVALPDGGKKE